MHLWSILIYHFIKENQNLEWVAQGRVSLGDKQNLTGLSNIKEL